MSSLASPVGNDPGSPNLPGVIEPGKISWEKTVPKRWWRNSHVKALTPVAFSKAAGRFSSQELPFKTLYLGSDSITCFWESGLGRNLGNRFASDRTITQEDLSSRIEYTVTLSLGSLRIFNACDASARRSAGALAIACFLADYAISQQWAGVLVRAGAHGILYPSVRSTDGDCLALFESLPASAAAGHRSASIAALSAPKKIRSCYENAPLLASLFKERVCLL